METVRKNITLPKDQAEIIERFTKLNGLTVSEFLRDTAMKEIERLENLDLLNYLKETCEYVSDEEQKEIDKLNLEEFKEDDFGEVSLDEILQS